MSPILRYLLFAWESIIYGPAYGYLNQLIRVPEPLDHNRAWDLITEDWPPLVNWLRKHYPPTFMRKLLLRRILNQDHSLGIENHYDVSNEFFCQFLDKKYVAYSCADFIEDNDTLEDAQTRKFEHILSMLRPKAGEKILELGPGWGSMLNAVYAVTGDKENLVGYTLSQQQIEYNKTHGGFNVELRDFITTEYEKEGFDAIYAVAVWEHVRPSEVSMLLKKLYEALKPGGRLIQHFFCLTTDTVPISCLAGQLIFPGSQLSSHRFHVRAFEKAGFQIHQQTVHDYRPTIRAWFENLTSNRERAIEAAGVREYNRFIIAFAATWKFFDDGEANVYRFELRKPVAKTNLTDDQIRRSKTATAPL